MKRKNWETWKVKTNIYRAHVIGKRLKGRLIKLVGKPTGEYYKSIKYMSNPSEWDFEFKKDKLSEVHKELKR